MSELKATIDEMLAKSEMDPTPPSLELMLQALAGNLGIEESEEMTILRASLSVTDPEKSVDVVRDYGMIVSDIVERKKRTTQKIPNLIAEQIAMAVITLRAQLHEDALDYLYTALDLADQGKDEVTADIIHRLIEDYFPVLDES